MATFLANTTSGVHAVACTSPLHAVADFQLWNVESTPATAVRPTVPPGE